MQRGKRNKKNIGASKNIKEEPIWKRGGKGLLLAWIMTIAGLLAGSAMIYWEWLSPLWIDGMAKVIMLLSMAAGGFYVFRNTKGQERIWVLFVLIIYLAIRFLFSLILTF